MPGAADKSDDASGADGMRTRCAAETRPRNVTALQVGADGLRRTGRFRCGRGDIHDAAVRRGAPLAAVEIKFPIHVVVIVGKRIEAAKWRVIISRARNVLVVGEVTLGRD